MIIQKIFPFPKIIILLQTQIYQKLEIIGIEALTRIEKKNRRKRCFWLFVIDFGKRMFQANRGIVHERE